MALETMQSLGQGNSDGRTFLIEPTYRSAFLDELFAVRPAIEPPYQNPPLLRCLFDHTKKVWEDPEFRESRVTFYSGLQRAEGHRLGLDMERRLERKSDVVPFLDQFCRALGFEARSRNRWRKKSGDVVFEVGVWLGGNVFRLRSPLKFRIFHVNEPRFAFETEGAAVLNRLVPGAGMYGRWSSDLDYILGVRALIELFNAIAGTLADA
ncbi:hypothetical protein [Bradyrhizobium genosp. P]|uniref:hypothetical protein n=1 Tax=Bradyrhizobium genosp. P TaxID=83641 RepID=UPI003CEBB63F